MRLGRSAMWLGRSAMRLGRSAKRLGRSANRLGRSATRLGRSVVRLGGCGPWRRPSRPRLVRGVRIGGRDIGDCSHVARIGKCSMRV
jgi:hypothetical protein